MFVRMCMRTCVWGGEGGGGGSNARKMLVDMFWIKSEMFVTDSLFLEMLATI